MEENLPEMLERIKEVLGHLNHINRAMDRLRENEEDFLSKHPVLKDNYFEMEEELVMAIQKLERLLD